MLLRKTLFVAKISLASVLLVGIVSNIYGSACANEVVRCAQYNALPWFDETKDGGGIGVDIISEVFALSDIDLVVRWYPVKRAFLTVASGGADLSLVWLKTPEREKAVIFSEEPVVATHILFYYRKEKMFEWETVDDLNGLVVGMVIGNRSISEPFYKAQSEGKLTVHQVANRDQLVKMLLAGRIDIIVGSSISMPYLLNTRFTSEERDQIAAHPKPFFTGQYYAIFNKNLSPQTIKSFNDGIRKMKESSRYFELLNEGLKQINDN